MSKETGDCLKTKSGHRLKIWKQMKGRFYLLVSALREVWDALHQPSHGSRMSSNLTVHRSIRRPKKKQSLHGSSPESLTVVQQVCM